MVMRGTYLHILGVLTSSNDPKHNVAVREHTDDLVLVGLEDRNGATVLLLHQLGRVKDRGVGGDLGGSSGHEVLGLARLSRGRHVSVEG
jgi:hypothetical protein